MQETILSTHIDTQKGYAFKSAWYVNEGYPIVKVSDFTDDSIDASNLVHIPTEVAENYLKYKLLAGDVVIQTVGSWPTNPASVVGKTIRVPKTAKKALLNQNAVKVIPRNSIHSGFLFYLLRSDTFKNYIVGTAQGAASQASITLDAIKEFKFHLPSFSKQVELSSILENYDTLIENNNRRIAILEEMAQSLYREWFVKFRYPGYESQKLVESQLGLIPEGWEVGSASQVININPRTTLKADGENPFISMSCLFENSMVIDGIESKKGNSGAKFINRDTLFSRITPCLQNGKIGFVQFLNGEHPVGFGSTEFIVFRETEKLSAEFIYLLSRTKSFRENAIQSMTGASGRQRVQNECFSSFHLAVPPLNVMREFTAIVAPMFKSIYNLSERNRNSKQQRDMLLPKLISGSITI